MEWWICIWERTCVIRACIYVIFEKWIYHLNSTNMMSATTKWDTSSIGSETVHTQDVEWKMCAKVCCTQSFHYILLWNHVKFNLEFFFCIIIATAHGRRHTLRLILLFTCFNTSNSCICLLINKGNEEMTLSFGLTVCFEWRYRYCMCISTIIMYGTWQQHDTAREMTFLLRRKPMDILDSSPYPLY